jgi:hypothetical protein
MGYQFNPFTGNLDLAGGSPPGGSDTEIQYNDNGTFAGSADLTWDDSGKVLDIGGDINLDDGGSFTTTLQVVTPTADRTISFPNLTGTVGLVAGSSTQFVYNNAGAYAGLSTLTTDGTNITLTGRFISSLNGAASAPPGAFTGTWFTVGTSTTTKPQVLIEPTGATSTAWSTSGTGLGVNAASGFAGNLLDLQVNGTRFASITSAGVLTCASASGNASIFGSGGAGIFSGSYVANVDSTTNTAAHGLARLTLGDGPKAFISYRNTSNVLVDGVFGFGGVTSSFPGLNRSGTTLRVRLADNSADAPLSCAALTVSGAVTVSAQNIVTDTTTGTKIGTATTQKLGFYNATPVVQPTAVADITTTATAGTLPTPDGTVTIADATTPTVTELLEYCVELESKLEAALGHLRTLGLIAT